MDKEQVISTIDRILKDKFGAGRIRPEDYLQEDLGLDSIDNIELVINIEDEFDMVIDETQAQKFKKVGDIYTYVQTVLL